LGRDETDGRGSGILVDASITEAPKRRAWVAFLIWSTSDIPATGGAKRLGFNTTGSGSGSGGGGGGGGGGAFAAAFIAFANFICSATVSGLLGSGGAGAGGGGAGAGGGGGATDAAWDSPNLAIRAALMEFATLAPAALEPDWRSVLGVGTGTGAGIGGCGATLDEDVVVVGGICNFEVGTDAY